MISVMTPSLFILPCSYSYSFNSTSLLMPGSLYTSFMETEIDRSATLYLYIQYQVQRDTSIIVCFLCTSLLSASF